jgi:hypothetical protein
MKTKTKIITLGALIVFISLLTGGYFALIYVPEWYQPAYVSIDEQQKLRDDFTAITTNFNNCMQHQESFDFTITDEQINRLLAGLEYIDPGLRGVLPSNIETPAVRFEDDYLKVGSVVEQNGKKVFASLKIKVLPLKDWLILDDFDANIGMYPLPRDMLKKRLARFGDHLEKYWPIIDKILTNGQYPNRFTYPNSNYDFKVTHLRASSGTLYITIEPMPRQKKSTSSGT